MAEKFTITQFHDRFPTDAACLEELKQQKYGTDYVCIVCGKCSRLTRVYERSAYACQCGAQVYPLAGTIFHKSSTSLRLWFYAMYLMSVTKSGISAKQLERELGVTYKTAWRMMMKIRSLMNDEDEDMLQGAVEIDELYLQPEWRFKLKYHGMGQAMRSEILFGMVERGGRVRVRHIPNAGSGYIHGNILQHVSKSAKVYTDQAWIYRSLEKKGYWHRTVNHSLKVYARGSIHTQTIEGFWSQIKRGFRGVYRHVSPKYLQLYANEYAWRYSNRMSEINMFDILLQRSEVSANPHHQISASSLLRHEV